MNSAVLGIQGVLAPLNVRSLGLRDEGPTRSRSREGSAGVPSAP